MAYVEITPEQLAQWSMNVENLIVIQLRASNSGSHVATVPLAIDIDKSELLDILRWMPPESRLVLCFQEKAQWLEPRIERSLLQVKIHIVYWLVIPAAMSIPAEPQMLASLGKIAVASKEPVDWRPFRSREQTLSRN